MHAPDLSHDLKVSKQMASKLYSTPEIRYPPDSITLMIANFSDEELTLPKGTILGVAQEVSDILVSQLTMRMTRIEVQSRHFFLETIKSYLRVLRRI